MMQTIHKNRQNFINQDSYESLIVAIEAGQGNLNLLLAVCDDTDYCESVTNAYEAELNTIGIQAFRSAVNFDDPSLYAALSRLYRSENYLQNQKRAVITITGIADLLNLRLGEQRSRVEIFSDYLQYTREGLRDFPFPIVLWLTEEIYDHIALNAIDFYSWRSGVFFFNTKKPFELTEKIIITPEVIHDSNKKLIQSPKTFSQLENQGVGILKIDDLEALIKQNNNESNLGLINLYSSLGSAYKHRLEMGQSADYQADLQAAITAYEKAMELQIAIGETIDLAVIYNNLANLHGALGNYHNSKQAEALLQKSLIIIENKLGVDHPLYATSLNNLAALYVAQKKLSEAENIFQRCLEIQESSSEDNSLSIATTLNNLANLYQSEGKYKESEELLLQALKLREEKLGEDHPYVAITLDSLARLYEFKKQFSKAKSILLRSLGILEKHLGDNHPDVANSLNNLAILYEHQGEYKQASWLYQKALKIFEKTLGVGHPDTMTIRSNYANRLKLITPQNDKTFNGDRHFSSSG